MASSAPQLSESSRQRLSGVRKAAIFLVAVGDEVGRKILQNLSEPDVRKITEQIAELRAIPPELSLEVVEEFHEMVETQQYMIHGGLDYATKLLVDTFGKQRAEDLLNLVKRAQEASQSDLAMLEKVDPQQLGKFLESEHPQTIAIVLAHLDARRGSVVIDSLSEERRVEAIRRLAAMRQFSPEMAQRVAMVLHRRLENMGETGRKSYSGFKAVADLLNRMESEQTSRMLQEIEAADPAMALSIRNLMFTFDDLVTIPPASIREIVSAADKRQLGLALRGAQDELRAHVFAAMSSRAAEMLKEDMEVMGPVRGREVAGAQQEILALARTLEAEGKVILKLEQGDDFIV
ncbi:MAG: flagellar motor switch protein FliG [Acidobacteriaceae bacterium]